MTYSTTILMLLLLITSCCFIQAQINITTYPSPLLISEGEAFNMSCFYGTTDTFQSWIHPTLGLITQSTGHLTLKVYRGTRVATLIVDSPSRGRDHGTYTCMVKNSVGMMLSGNVQAHFVDGIQIITPTHQSFNVFEGGSVSLPCVAKDAAKIEWRKVPISTELRNTSDGHVVILPDRLVIDNVRFSDNGSYECTVTASNHRNSIIAHLLVHASTSETAHYAAGSQRRSEPVLESEYSDNKEGPIRVNSEDESKPEAFTTVSDAENLENIDHYKAYETALQGGQKLMLRYLKFLFLGPPRSGKTSFRKRLIKEIHNIGSLGEPSISTGVAETNDVIITKLTSETAYYAAGSQWRSIKRSSEARQQGMYSDEDVDYLTRLFYQLISRINVSLNSTEPVLESEYSDNKEGPIHVNYEDESKPEAFSTVSDAEEMEIKDAFDMLSTKLKSDSPEELHHSLNELIMINMVDVGGQPAFLDMLPALTIGPALNLLFFRLDQGLKQHYPVRFYAADTKDEVILESSYCTEELLFQSLASISCFSGYPSQRSAESVSSHAILIGTYKDQVTNNEIFQKERAIKKKFHGTKLYKDGLLLKTMEGKSFFSVDNMKGTEESEMSDIRKNIEEVIKIFPAVPIPASWLMFRIVLHYLHKPIVSISLCERIAKRLSMPTPVQEAIWFFHHNIGSLMYYPEIPSMQEVVICNPQVIFDSVSKLIIDRIKYSNYGLVHSVVDEFHQKGQFRLSDIEKETEHQRNSLLTPKQLVDVLTYLNILAELKHDLQVNPSESKFVMPAVFVDFLSYFNIFTELRHDSPPEPKFMMPAMLKYAAEEDLKPSTSTKEASPLLIYFDGGYVPFGVYSASIARLIAHQDLISPRWQLCDEQIMKNYVKFIIDKAFYATLISRPQYIEVQVERHPQARTKYSLVEICSTVRQIVVETLEAVISIMKYKPYTLTNSPSSEQPFNLAFTCCLKDSHSDHLMKIAKDDGGYYAECLQRQLALNLKNKHLIWFNEAEQQISEMTHPEKSSTSNYSGDKVNNLHDLLQAVESIGNWRGLCINLKVDDGEINKLVNSNTHIDDKKIDCLQAYFNSGEAKWSEVVKAVAKSPINNRRIAKQIANENGVRFEDELCFQIVPFLEYDDVCVQEDRNRELVAVDEPNILVPLIV